MIQLRKTIDKTQQRMQEYLEMIEHPEKSYKNWDSMSERHRRGAIENWEKEIRTFEKNIRQKRNLD